MPRPDIYESYEWMLSPRRGLPGVAGDGERARSPAELTDRRSAPREDGAKRPQPGGARRGTERARVMVSEAALPWVKGQVTVSGRKANSWVAEGRGFDYSGATPQCKRRRWLRGSERGTERPEVYSLEFSAGSTPTALTSLPQRAEEAPACWLAGYTRPRHEQKVAEYFLGHRWQVFLPTHSSWRYWSDRRKLVRLPLFPSYIFVKLSAAEQREAVRAPGLVGWVRGEYGAARVAEEELRTIAKLLQSGVRFDPLPEAQIGDEVEITAGALRGCRGYLLRKDQGAIALLVSAINGGVRVSLPDPSWVRAVPRARRATASA